MKFRHVISVILALGYLASPMFVASAKASNISTCSEVATCFIASDAKNNFMVSEATSTYAHIGVVKANFSVNTHSAIKLLKTGYLDQNLQMQHSVERYIFYSLVLENLHPTLNKLRRLNI